MPALQVPALPQPARVIVLNGPSSAGKTRLAQAMQSCWHAPLHHVQADAFRAMEPPGYWDGWEQGSAEAAELKMAALCRAMVATVRALSTHGQEVVLDTALTNPFARHLVVCELGGLPVYLIGVHCTPAELARREQVRGDRPVGLAARQAGWLHRRMEYDFEVDTTARAPETVAAEIAQCLAGQRAPQALQRLRAQLDAA